MDFIPFIKNYTIQRCVVHTFFQKTQIKNGIFSKWKHESKGYLVVKGRKKVGPTYREKNL